MSKQMNLVQFADVTTSPWIAKIKVIRKIKNNPGYSPKTDFYKQMREYIVRFHESGKSLNEFEDATRIVCSCKKQKTYEPLVKAYKSFLKTRKNYKYFKAPRGVWSYAGMNIVANPEIGLEVKGEKYLIKLFFKVAPLSKVNADIIKCIMEQALRESAGAHVKLCVLDVLRSKLYVSSNPSSEMVLANQAEAKYISEMWGYS